jgi:hypothetical protein
MIHLKDYPTGTRALIKTRNTVYEIELEEPVGNVLIIEVEKTRGKVRYPDWTPVMIPRTLNGGVSMRIHQDNMDGGVTTTPIEEITIPYIREPD